MTPSKPAPVPEARPARGSRLRRITTLGFYVAVIALLAAYVSRIDFATLAGLRLAWGYLLGGLAVGFGQRMILPLVWVLIVRDLGVVVRDYPAYNFVYAKAWLGRYLPGKVAMVAARVYFAEELGASRSAMAVSSVAELGAQLLVTVSIGLVGVASVGGAVEVIAPYRPIAYAMVALLALMLWPRVFNGVVALLYRVLGRSLETRPKVGASTITRAVVGFLVVSLLSGAMSVLFAASVDLRALDHPTFVWGAYSLAGALGMAFVLAPSGLGAREAVQIPLYTLVFSAEAAVAIAVVSRVAEVAIDVLFYGASAGWSRASKRPRRA